MGALGSLKDLCVCVYKTIKLAIGRTKGKADGISPPHNSDSSSSSSSSSNNNNEDAIKF